MVKYRDDPGYFPDYDGPNTAQFEAKREAYAEAIDYSRAHPICPQQYQSVQDYEHSLIASLAHAVNIGCDMNTAQLGKVIAGGQEFSDRVVRLANSAPYRAGELRSRVYVDGAGREITEFRGPKTWMNHWKPVGVHVMVDPMTGKPVNPKML